MVSIHQGRLSIRRNQFTKRNDLISLILLIMLIGVGILGTVEFTINGIVSIVIIAIVYILNKVTNWKWHLQLCIAIICSIIASFIFSIPWIFTCLISGFLSCIFCIPTIYKSYKTAADFEIFFIDQSSVGCIFLENPNQYKGLALNPSAYFHKIPLHEIAGVSWNRNKIIFARIQGTVQPLYLTSSEHAAIYAYIAEKFPSLIQQSDTILTAKRKDVELYNLKIIIILPFIVFPILIYFFADNGRNTELTIYLIFGMIISSALLWIWTRK